MENLKPQMKKEKKENGLINVLINVVIPTLILTKLSKDQYLGQQMALIIALIFPISYGAWDLITRKKVNFFSALGLISILMTGGIGLLNLNKNWMVAKETGIPLLMGLAVLISQYTKYPLVRTFLGQILNIDLIDKSFKEHGHDNEFEEKMAQSSFFLAATFFVSAILNYVLAIQVLVGEPGSVEFNESLGKMTAYSFPVISIPTTIMIGFVLYRLVSSIKKVTGLDFEEVINN